MTIDDFQSVAATFGFDPSSSLHELVNAVEGMTRSRLIEQLAKRCECAALADAVESDQTAQLLCAKS